MFHSRLLADLDRRMRSSRDDVAWARDMCRAASQLGRQGQTELAMQAIGHVRAHYGHDLHVEVACWLMLAEGVLHFFQMRGRDARDRAQRAHAIAVALDVRRARPTCAAWMANIEFNDNRFDAMLARLEEALRWAPDDDDQARARACLVMADALHFCGQYTQARPWYDRTRVHAAREGDQATLSALFHNMAAFRTLHVRLADAFEPTATPTDAHLASIEAMSVSTYDSAIGTRSFRGLVPLIKGQLLTVKKQFDAALDIFESIDPAAVPTKLDAAALADKAWCLASLGRADAAREAARQALARLPEAVEADEQAHALARLAAVEDLIGEPLCEDARGRAEAALATHRLRQQSLCGQLQALVQRLGDEPGAQAKKNPA